MEIVNFLAELWGFCMIIVCLSFLVKPKHVKNLLAIGENQTALLFVGLFDVLFSVAVLLSYNTWDSSWRVIVTILGWLLLIKGVFYLFMPETAVKMMKKWEKEYLNLFPIGLVVGVVVGCLLVYLGINF